MKLYKSLEILIVDEKENESEYLVQKLYDNSIYQKWTHSKSIKNNKHSVIIQIIETVNEKRFNEIKEFVKLIKQSEEIINYFKMNELSIKIDYEYDEQCNMEFSPNELKKLGENGIILCISCWKK